MGIFTRSRDRAAAPVAAAVWQPAGDEPDATPGYLMDDDGCAGNRAYGVTFTLAGRPAATLTIWAYAAYGPEDSYIVGYRWQQRVSQGRREPWIHDQYGWLEEDGWYTFADGADSAALEAVRKLAAEQRDSTSADRLGCFDWNGVAW